MPEDSPNFLSPGGNYQNLLSYRRSGIIYDFTYRFWEKHLKRGVRSIEEMVQAARSGKQKIAEGGKASVTLPEMDLTLPNVTAPALKNCSSTTRTRVRDLPLWDKSSPEARNVRKQGKKPTETFETYRPFIDTRHPLRLRGKKTVNIDHPERHIDAQGEGTV